ncbi:CAP-associated domain-containing protein [Macrococcoides caseolyticum]|uniref:CAP domain-containing protein n=1 Tax=Macrococcoides caseolyticum TaxID=69966 RepID=UPI001EEF2D38|nr:CAP-associated domain-containing protein [Macrococcus caseolyticus]MCE4957170.1 hypothetical protein [Macrococcus caseolyticus]
MKHFILTLLLIIFILIFPLKIFQLSDELILYHKAMMRTSIEKLSASQYTQTNQNDFKLIDIQMGMTRKEVNAILGKPVAHLSNEYGHHWSVYFQNKTDLILVMLIKNRVEGIYLHQSKSDTQYKVKFGMTPSEVRNVLGQKRAMSKGKNYQLTLDKKHQMSYEINANYLTIYYDKYKSNTVTALKVVSQKAYDKQPSYYALPTHRLLEDYKKMQRVLINATRATYQLNTLKPKQNIQYVAQLHAFDMGQNHYFSHYNKQNESPFDRIKRGQINYRFAGENLAFGQRSPIDAHHALMNSLGHRKNILKPEYETIGIGVSFNQFNQPFYVENYITE